MAKSSNSPAPAKRERFDAFTVREYTVEGEQKSEWLKIGVAFPHEDGKGFSIKLDAVPVNGQIQVRKFEPKPE